MNEQTAQNAVKVLLEYIDEDPMRDGLIETPHRVAKALKEITVGYSQDPEKILSKTFQNGDDDEPAAVYNGMVVLTGIEFYSLCEHHMLPFIGKAHVAYIPGEDGRIVGISKLARLVDVYARRLQVQERMTAQIADAIERHLGASGVAVMVEATHLCMVMRGVKKANPVMVTSEVRGAFKEDARARSEVLSLLRGE